MTDLFFGLRTSEVYGSTEGKNRCGGDQISSVGLSQKVLDSVRRRVLDVV